MDDNKKSFFEKHEGKYRQIGRFTKWHLLLYVYMMLFSTLLEGATNLPIVGFILVMVFLLYFYSYGYFAIVMNVIFCIMYLVGVFHCLFEWEAIKHTKWLQNCLIGAVLNGCFCWAHFNIIIRMF